MKNNNMQSRNAKKPPVQTKNSYGVYRYKRHDDYLYLSTIYPHPNHRGEEGWELSIGGLPVLPSDKSVSYDGIGIDMIKNGMIEERIYLEIGFNQLEALRQFLNDWHNDKQAMSKN